MFAGKRTNREEVSGRKEVQSTQQRNSDRKINRKKTLVFAYLAV